MVRDTDDEPILIDFGLSKQYDASGEQTSTTPIGISHGYAPIEQYRPGGVATFTPQTDVYALGATLFALLTGDTPPHYSDILEDGFPELPDSVTSQTASAIEKAMETKKIKRPASIELFINMLPRITVESIDQNNNLVITPPAKVKVSNNSESIPKVDTPHLKCQDSKAIEETVILLNIPLSSQGKQPLNSQINREVYSEEIQYIDLGLSVKWATKISGTAIPNQDNNYSFHLRDHTKVSPEEFLNSDHKLPSINNYEELLERCSWTTISENGIHGYKIVGPNGNTLIMPLGTLNNYLTLQTLKPDRMGYCYFLYLSEYTHTLTKGVPVEANIWTVK